MGTYVFSSHDGFGLGHVRRNVLLANEVRRRDPRARTVVVTGVDAPLPWLRGVEVVRVPSMVKDHDGRYANAELGPAEALQRRADVFEQVIDDVQPDVVVVDRHPSGIAGELRGGLAAARRRGAATVLGLRDILDDAPAVWAELAGANWADIDFDRVLVYGDRHLCDHEAEYGLPVTPAYVGWVTDPAAGCGAGATAARCDGADRDDHLLVIASGGGGDGAQVTDVGVELVRRNPQWRALVVNGPHGEALRGSARIEVRRGVDGCGPLFARAGASVQMAGYNSTVEAIAAGLRPILVPRRAPRREQAIRAARLSALGVADVVDHGADVGDVAWLLSRPRRLRPGVLADAGLRLDGAARAAQLLVSMGERVAA
ncbi:MAG: hypothetical protein AB7O92_32850 [Acidimicrobiia bacterium]